MKGSFMATPINFGYRVKTFVEVTRKFFEKFWARAF